MTARDNIATLVDWTPVSVAMPDDDQTVLVYMPGADPDVWPGYHDGDDGWKLADGMPVQGVASWAHMPEGPR